MNFFIGTIHLPWIIGLLVIVIEFFGSLCLVIGFAGRAWAALFISLVFGIIITVQKENEFFMNWFGNQKSEGYEHSLLLLGLSLATLVSGSGKYSIDAAISKRN